MRAERVTPAKMDLRSTLSKIGPLVDMVGDVRFPLEIARFVHARVSAEQVHLVRVGKLDADSVLSASHDGSDAALKLTRQFYSRNMNRFEQKLITNDIVGPPNIFVVNDHTQLSASPEFRSFGREVGIGARCLVRRDSCDGAVVLSMLWPLAHGDVSNLQQEINLLSDVLAPFVSKHFEICENRTQTFQSLSSVSKLESSLHKILGVNRPREVQVAARLIAGLSSAQIAAELMIARDTVIFHRKRIYERLEVRTQRDLLLWYLWRGSVRELPGYPVH